MRITKEALSVRIVVRRVEVGTAAPFRWEVYWEEGAEPIHVSPGRYRSMEAAYCAGQARLTEFIPKRSIPPEVIWNRHLQSRPFGVSNHDIVDNADSYAML
jgi:hypothetical protein